ncbi:hypothetical protein M9H77_14186 [Catharanthus roseus]|uniref:Uncharacterized protein n=1 Tax=Catharanthus roseus TaxID=4058 RepID=A0ACC0BMA9_CATRO|nr:hypothetical protein M9H77_14186 [Catharanthus roseus]
MASTPVVSKDEAGGDDQLQAPAAETVAGDTGCGGRREATTSSFLPHLPAVLQEMGEKKKAGAILVRLVSAAGTGFFYVVKKTKRLQSSQTKLEFRKYDPRVNRHVLFTEAKMK